MQRREGIEFWTHPADARMVLPVIRYVKKIDCGNVVRYPCETHLINCFGDCHDR